MYIRHFIIHSCSPLLYLLPLRSTRSSQQGGWHPRDATRDEALVALVPHAAVVVGAGEVRHDGGAQHLVVAANGVALWVEAADAAAMSGAHRHHDGGVVLTRATSGSHRLRGQVSPSSHPPSMFRFGVVLPLIDDVPAVCLSTGILGGAIRTEGACNTVDSAHVVVVGAMTSAGSRGL